MKQGTKILIKISVAILSVFLVINYWNSIAGILAKVLSAASPLILGCIFAYPLNILMSFYEKHLFKKAKNKASIKLRSPLSLVLALFTLIIIITLVIALVVPQLISCGKVLITELPNTFEALTIKLNAFLKEHNIEASELLNKLSNINWQSSIQKIVETVSSGFSDVFTIVINTVSSVVSGVTSTVIALIFAIYLLLSKKKLSLQIKRIARKFVKEDIYKKASHIINVVDNSFHKFIVGQCTEAVILGVLCAIGMLILRLPYAAMVGTVIGFSALIPVVGAFLGGAVGAFLIFTESPLQALIFLIFLVILQQLEGNLIYPKVVGSSIGLPAMWVLAAVTIGGGVFGIVGMLLGVPLAGAAYRLLREYLNEPSKDIIDASENPEPTAEA